MAILDRFDIKGRSAFVTGAASGIGLAYAEAMAEAGASVTLTDIDAEGAEREAARLRAEGYEARADKLDVSLPPSTRMPQHTAGSISASPMPGSIPARASGTRPAIATPKARSILTTTPAGTSRSR